MSYTPSVTSLVIDKDKDGGSPTGLRSVPNYIIQKVLSADTAASITVPSGATKVVLSCDQNFYVNCNGTAAISAATDGSGSELNPVGYVFNSDNRITTISVISHSAGNLTAAFYS